MRFTLRDQQTSTSHLTRLYIAALGIIAVLAIAGQIFIQIALLQQSGDANVINIAGRQRMLSQKLCKAALAFLITSDPSTQQARLGEMQATLLTWEQAHDGLLHGNAQLGLPGNNSDIVTNLFISIEPNFQAMRQDTEEFIQKVVQSPSSGTALRNDLLPFVQDMLIQDPTFLTGMNNIVAQYQKEAEARVLLLKVTELILLGMTLIVLTLEGFLIFRPAIERLNRTVTALVKAEKQISEQVADLEHQNADMELALQEALAAHRKVVPHARVIAFGHYQVQSAQGKYWNVKNQKINNSLQLVCECFIYRRNMICSHSLAAGTLHAALVRQRGLSGGRLGSNSLAEGRGRPDTGGL